MNIETNGEENKALNRWLQVSGTVILVLATVGCSLMGWMASSINELNISVSYMRAELDVVKPAEVLNAVQALKDEQLRKVDVQQIISEGTPWVQDRPEWMTWRREIESRLSMLEKK